MAFIEPMHRNKPNITYLLTSFFWEIISYVYLQVGRGSGYKLQ